MSAACGCLTILLPSDWCLCTCVPRPRHALPWAGTPTCHTQLQKRYRLCLVWLLRKNNTEHVKVVKSIYIYINNVYTLYSISNRKCRVHGRVSRRGRNVRPSARMGSGVGGGRRGAPGSPPPPRAAARDGRSGPAAEPRAVSPTPVPVARV
jgi:hypothetical protein